MTRTLYMPWPEQAALIRERYRQPITFQGQTFTPTSVCAKEFGIRTIRLIELAHDTQTHDTIITLDNGVRYVRLPRHRGDQQPPYYWDLDSLRKVFA